MKGFSQISKILLIVASLVVIITAVYGIANSQKSSDVVAYGEEDYQLNTGEKVDNMTVKNKVGGAAILDPSLLLDSTKAGQVVSVDYYANGRLVQSVQQAPFYLDTTLLRNGSYKIKSTIIFLDGSVQEQEKEIEIENR